MKHLNVTWQPEGIFKLFDSNNHVGSLYSFDDMMTILSIPPENQKALISRLNRSTTLYKNGLFLEPQLSRSKKWKEYMVKLGTIEPKRYQTLSELELIALIRVIYGSQVEIEPQVKVANKYVDIKVIYQGQNIYIEFLGPSHFEEDKILQDTERKQIIEASIDGNLIEWPYWIQFCEQNVKIAFGERLKGKGAIWGSEMSWGGVTNQVKERILALSKTFNAISDDGIGYIYEEWKDERGNIIKPAHPIINKILDRDSAETIDLLLPENYEDEGRNFWLPKELWDIQ